MMLDDVIPCGQQREPRTKTSMMQTISHHHSASNFYISDGGCEFERDAPLFLQREAEDNEPQVRKQKKRSEWHMVIWYLENEGSLFYRTE